MTETPERLVERLQAEGEKSLDFFQALTPQQWEMTVYSEGTDWTLRVLLSHFVSTELGFHAMIEDILAGGMGAPEGFDIDRFNAQKAQEMSAIPWQALLEQFAAARQSSIDLVKRMRLEDLQRSGRHPFLGVVPLEDILKLLYRHNQIHQRDARKLLAGSGEERTAVS